MSFLCGLISCKEKCAKYPALCQICDKAEYSPVNASNVACYPDIKGDDSND